MARSSRRHLAEAPAALLASERIVNARDRLPGRPQLRHIAQVGRPTRAEAETLCRRLRAEGAACIVLRN